MKNSYEISADGKTATIWIKRRTGERLACLIDAADLPKLKEVKVSWYALRNEDIQNFYAVCNVPINRKQHKLYMHRFLMDAPKDLEVDHKHHNTLDNRRSNLRAVTPSMNMMNRRGADRDSKSGHRGISPCQSTGRFKLRVTIDGKQTHGGYFATIEEALIARNAFPGYAADTSPRR